MSRTEHLAEIDRLRPELRRSLALDSRSDEYVAGVLDGVRRDVAAKTDATREDTQVHEDRAALASMASVIFSPGMTPAKERLDEAHERAEAERIEASKAGPPVGAMVRRSM